MNKIIFLMFCLLLSCASSQTKVEVPASEPINTPENKIIEPEPNKENHIDSVTRTELDEFLAKGPAYLLAMVQVDSETKDGRFVGFKIISFRFDAVSVLGLRQGDIVQKINKMSPARPEQYFEIYKNLKDADKISFKILRDKSEVELTTDILP